MHNYSLSISLFSWINFSHYSGLIIYVNSSVKPRLTQDLKSLLPSCVLITPTHPLWQHITQLGVITWSVVCLSHQTVRFMKAETRSILLPVTDAGLVYGSKPFCSDNYVNVSFISPPIEQVAAVNTHSCVHHFLPSVYHNAWNIELKIIQLSLKWMRWHHTEFREEKLPQRCWLTSSNSFASDAMYSGFVAVV